MNDRIDRESFARSNARLEVTFDEIITAQGSIYENQRSLANRYFAGDES